MPEDPQSFISPFHARWNANDVDGVLGYFADDAVVSAQPPPPPPAPGSWQGKDEIRSFLKEHLDGTFHVDSSNGREEGGNILWEFSVSSPVFRGMGVDPTTGTAEVSFEGENVKAFTFTLDQDTLSKMQAAGGAA